MTSSRDIAYVRKMCGLGYPAQTLVHALLPAIRHLVPAHSGGVFWVDRHGEMASLYAERLLPPEAMAAYHERHYRRSQEGFAAAFERRARSPDPVSFHAFTRAEQSSDYFRDVLQPLDAYHAMYGILHDDIGPFAQMSLYRGADDRPFDVKSAAAMRGLLRYMAAGLARKGSRRPEGEATVMAEEQLGILRRDGHVVAASDHWRRLLRLAALSSVAPHLAIQESSVIARFLGEVAGRAFARAGPGAGVDAPGERLTPWGRFAWRAFRLQDFQGRRAEQVGLLIRRDEPRALALLRGAAAAGLSPQQMEVAMVLADGLSNREIGTSLGFSLNTANYHVKQVHHRLGVAERTHVEATLLDRAR